MDTDQQSTAVAEPREKPDAQVINEMIKGAVNDAAAAGKFDDFAMGYSTRRMLWEGQTKDGRLPKINTLPKDRKVFTWEGAPDTRVPYADELCIEHMLFRTAVLQDGEIRLGPRETEAGDGTEDEDKASAWQEGLNFWLDVSRGSFHFQQRLFNSCIDEMGYSGVFVGCRRKIRTAKLTVKVTDLLELLTQKAMQEVIGQLSTVNGDQHPEEAASAITPEIATAIEAKAQETLELLLTKEGDAALRDLLREFDPQMPKTEVRIAARELRANASRVAGSREQGAAIAEAVYYAPQDDGYWPLTQALVPFVNWVHGSDLKGDGTSWWHAFPDILCETDVRARAAAEEWNDDFLEAVLKHPNQFLFNDLTWEGRVPKWACAGAGIGQVISQGALTKEKFYQVVYVWREMVDGAGLPMVYETLVCPHENTLYGFHECRGLESLPVHVECREEVLYAWQSRGIPHIVLAGQNEIKDLMDAEGARGQLASNPPLNRSSKGHVPIEPGRQLFSDRGETNAFLTVPTADPGTVSLMDRVRDMMDRRFFRNKDADPDVKRLYRKLLAFCAAESIRAVARLIWKVMQARVDSLKVGRIAGRPVNLELSRDSMQGDVDVTVEFSVEGLSVDAGTKLLDWGTKLTQMGADNVDVNELVNVIARITNPGAARRFMLSADTAAERSRQDQRNRISNMWSGSPMDYPERQTGLDGRMEEMQMWKSDPENMGRLSQSPRFAQQMQAEEEYLQNQYEQYKKNPQRGRSVAPKAEAA